MSIVLTVDLPGSAYLGVLLENQNWVQKLDVWPMGFLADSLVTVSSAVTQILRRLIIGIFYRAISYKFCCGLQL